ncbi:MAG TPA: glycosyltransferase [Chloroflexota bacterium]
MTTRIAFLSLHSSPLAKIGTVDAGGMNVYVGRLAEELARLDVQVDIFTRRTSSGTPEIVEGKHGVRVVHLDAGPARQVPKSALPLYVPALAASYSRFTKRHCLEYDLLHAHYWLSGLVGLEVRGGAPLVAMFHTLARVKEFYSGGPDPSDSSLRYEGERRVMENADAVTVATADEELHMERLYGVKPLNYVAIPPGVDLRRFSPGDKEKSRQRLQIAADKTVLFVGRLDPIKGLDALLWAMADIRPRTPQTLKLVVVTDTGEESPRYLRYRKLASGLGLDGVVEFRDLVPQKTLAHYYRAADVCVVPSAYESFGMAAVEAMACATPVVAFRVGGLASTIAHDETGYLASPGSRQDLAQQLFRAVTSDDLPAMGARARDAVEQYSWARTAGKTRDLYDRMRETVAESLTGA